MNRILIASILKPVNDPRMYEKFGISISGTEGAEVHIAGFKKAGEDGSGKTGERIVLHPIFDFKRLSLARVFAPWRLFRIMIKVKPKVIIATTFEILIVTILYKILFGAKILYDIQENYYRNIAYNNTYPPLIRNILAVYSRLTEYISSPFINHFILAERNYEKEFSFSKGKSLVIENKYRETGNNPPVIIRKKPVPEAPLRLLYSGTISEGYGIFEAVRLTEKLHEINPRITLDIIGYCSSNHTLKELQKRIEGKSFIRLTGGGTLVSHHLILKAVAESDFGLLSYQPNKSTQNCIPTRLFEYQAYLLPMIIQENKLWKEVCEPHHSAVFINYRNFDVHALYTRLMQESFYPNGPVPDVLWKSEEAKLINLLRKYLQ